MVPVFAWSVKDCKLFALLAEAGAKFKGGNVPAFAYAEEGDDKKRKALTGEEAGCGDGVVPADAVGSSPKKTKPAAVEEDDE